MRENAHEKRACCLFRDFRGPKRRCAPRSGRHPGRSGVPDVELLQKVALKKEDACGVGSAQGTAPAAGPLNRAKVCSKKRPVVPDRNGIPADRMLHCDKMLHKKGVAKLDTPGSYGKRRPINGHRLSKIRLSPDRRSVITNVTP